MLAVVAVLMLPSLAFVGAAGDMMAIRTANVGDVVVTVLGATDGWTTGDNTFVLEFGDHPWWDDIDSREG